MPGGDESDPHGVWFDGTTLFGFAANVAAGASFAILFNALLN